MEEQRHYFMNVEHSPEDYFSFDMEYRGYKLNINSCKDIFSKDELDNGTKVLLDTVLDQVVTDPAAPVSFLDIGCGYGVIGMVLGLYYSNSTVDMLDINRNAVELARKNATNNRVDNVRDVFVSDGYTNVINNYDYIITNPPIKAGKKNLFMLVGESIYHLNDGGKVVLVIRKDHGEESLKKMMEETFGNCEILKRSEGFYILCSQKRKA